MRAVRVLLIDDSRTMRALIRARLSRDRRVEVVGEAADAAEARALIKAVSPDVLTLDVELPRMDGLEFLGHLMRLRPMPVVMISAATRRSDAAALRALSLGAVACIGKPRADGAEDSFRDLAEIIVSASRADVRPVADRSRAAVPARSGPGGPIVLIGASTGGVEALETVLAGFPADCPPTVIVQHMPPAFLCSLARRLGGMIAPDLLLASDGMPIRQGRICLAPGGDAHLVLTDPAAPVCGLVRSAPRSGHRPSVDALFQSAVPVAGRVVAAVLTGMGRDGAEGMLSLRRAGAACLAQDESSSVVFGMPQAALALGGAERAVPLERMSAAILDLAGRDRAGSARRPVAGER